MGVRYLYTTLNSGHIIADTDTFLHEGNKAWPDSKGTRWNDDEDGTDADILC